VDLAGYLYGEMAAARRAWYARCPTRVRRLTRPVVSVGNLSVGGSGKTPVVAHLAGLLQEAGHRPAVLSRGYARERARDGVVVVSDGARVCADLASSGDEPLMLARAIEGVPVLVCPDRYLAGRLAELHFGSTVHLLDDGFQHHELARNVNLLIVETADVTGGQPLPFGRLREPLRVARAADALLVPDVDEAGARERAARLGVASAFALRRVPQPALRLGPDCRAMAQAPGARVLALAGIARPARFFNEVRAAGWNVVERMSVGDHHRYDEADVDAVARALARSSAELVLTTEKDLMRLLPFHPLPFPLAWVPLTVDVEPRDAFRHWLVERVRIAATPQAGRA
jgi:tetraacyldisaccharide 4'-kinase